MKFARRMDNLPPYVFAGMAKRLADLKAAGVDVINFGMGDPDVPTPNYLLDATQGAVLKPENSRYPNYFGKPALREAIAAWYETRFGVSLNAKEEVLPLIGSKEGIANASLAFVDTGDVVFVPDPSYPVYKYGTLIAGGENVSLPLIEENGWLPDLESLDPALCRRASLIWLNYPNNPTGAVADLEFFERVVHWARQYDVIVAHDNPYSEIAYDGFAPPSFLQVPGAMEIGVEFNSLSKTYSMAGFRIGMAVGSAKIIEVLGRIKSNIDSGIYGAIQDAAIAALTGDQTWIPERNRIYERRRDKLCAALEGAGIKAPRPKSSLYIWAQVPEGYTSGSFADHLLDRTGIIVTPGPSYGTQGEGYFRMSLTVPDEQVESACERLRGFRVVVPGDRMGRTEKVQAEPKSTASIGG